MVLGQYVFAGDSRGGVAAQHHPHGFDFSTDKSPRAKSFTGRKHSLPTRRPWKMEVKASLNSAGWRFSTDSRARPLQIPRWELVRSFPR